MIKAETNGEKGYNLVTLITENNKRIKWQKYKKRKKNSTQKRKKFNILISYFVE